MRMGILSRGGINATCTARNNFRHAYRQILRKIDIVDHRSAKPGEPKR